MFQRFSMKSAVLAIVFALSLAAHASANELKTVSVPPGDLGKALRVLADQVGVEFVYQSDQIRGRRTGGVSGEYSARDAVIKLLEGTALQLRTDQASGALLITDPSSNSRRVDSSRTQSGRDTTQTGLENSTLAQNTEGSPSSQDRQVSANEVSAETPRAPLDEKPQEIVVTGTRIRAANPTLPLIQYEREQLDQTGYSTTQEFVRSVPQNYSGSGGTEEGRFGDSTSEFVGINTTAATSIDLRGLGPASTLVLVNGRRLAPAAIGSFVDVSLIPFAAIERVDVLTDGASAVYGADAVGGVVNFVLRRDYDGAETRVRYGSVTEGDRSEQLVAQTLGGNWRTGTALATIQYQKQTALNAADRPKESGSLLLPSDLFPESEATSGFLSARQDLSSSVELFTQALLSRRETERDASPGFGGGVSTTASGTSEQTSVLVGGRYTPTADWIIELSAQHAIQSDEYGSVDRNADDTTLQALSGDAEFEANGVDILVTGPLFTTSAGRVQLAFGGGFRDEDFELLDTYNFGGGPFELGSTFERDVTFFFGEVLVPLLGPNNNSALGKALDFSVAVRNDDYSDFGSTTNPRVGLHWSPIDGVDFRASYGESFRAPTANDISTASINSALIIGVPAPDGSTVPVFTTFFNQLTPETAEIFSVGGEFRFGSLDGLKLSINYYDISYTDRIAFPPSIFTALLTPDVYAPVITEFSDDVEAQAYLDALIASGAAVTDFVGTGSTGVRFALNGGQQNLGEVDQSGFDVLATYAFSLGTGTATISANATNIDRIETAFSKTAPSIDVVGTYSNPVDWRARLGLGWSGQALDIFTSVNYVDNYGNPGRDPAIISSWTTVDVSSRLRLEGLSGSSWAKGASISLNIQNAFDETPPRIDTASSFSGVAYDQANATALGRFVSIELRKDW